MYGFLSPSWVLNTMAPRNSTGSHNNTVGSGATWRPEGQLNPQVAFGVINSSNALSGTGNDGLSFRTYSRTVHTSWALRVQFGQEHFNPGIESFY